MASNENVSPCCPLCSKLYKEPLILQCLHSFCKKCLQKYVDKEGIADRKVKCPCGVHSKLPSDGIAGFPQTLRLNHLSGLSKEDGRQSSNVTAVLIMLPLVFAAIAAGLCMSLVLLIISVGENYSLMN